VRNQLTSQIPVKVEKENNVFALQSVSFEGLRVLATLEDTIHEVLIH
jgi:hypothetical protein